MPTLACPRRLVCVVVDECHRAVGDAPAAKACGAIRSDRATCRIIGLSATPGSTAEAVQVGAGPLWGWHHMQYTVALATRAITRLRAMATKAASCCLPYPKMQRVPPYPVLPVPQEVVNNLGVHRIEFRSEADPDVAPYCHSRDVEVSAWSWAVCRALPEPWLWVVVGPSYSIDGGPGTVSRDWWRHD